MLEKELIALGAKEVEILRRAVAFKGESDILYRSNIFLRTALSVLEEISTFQFETKEDFFGQMRAIQWDKLFSHQKTIAISAIAHRTEIFDNTLFLAQLSKDAIVDYFRDHHGVRPNVDPHNPQVGISVYILGDRCVVSLDSSGEALFKRGYRKATGPAPINEVLAAGLIALSEWDGVSTFLDPMCGSGTFSIEAAMMSAGIAPNESRKEFGFCHWNDFDPTLLEEEKRRAAETAGRVRAKIRATDLRGSVLEAARKNVMAAGFTGIIGINKNDFFTMHPRDEAGWLLINPPYGHRMLAAESTIFYKNVGDSLKQRFSGFRAGIITSDLEAQKRIGLKPAKKLTVFNGPLECAFLVYDLFAGKHKDHMAKKSTPLKIKRRRVGEQ